MVKVVRNWFLEKIAHLQYLALLNQVRGNLQNGHVQFLVQNQSIVQTEQELTISNLPGKQPHQDQTGILYSVLQELPTKKAECQTICGGTTGCRTICKNICEKIICSDDNATVKNDDSNVCTGIVSCDTSTSGCHCSNNPNWHP